ncbi:MAG: branched-chain amino acid transport system substrate-binding protein [Acetobacteraceae bacterium]|jgi:branched-chain amino acid transport system substrate-binding protein|nr:branched-chain amino acid transport system substrate-binding protein [Acetobacteraceae bacterium]MEA2789278.1 branched-chain amino acid transport system substrate-binding protein [Acetobacteraceae bacterium]
MWIRCAAIAVALLLPAALAKAELPETIKIGILNDMNGPFADQSGRGSVVAAQMAAEAFAAQSGGLKVEILSADHLNKPDVGAQIVRAWVDRDGVAAVADAVNSGVGLAVNTVMAEKHRTFVATNVGTSDLTGKFCQPTTVQWTMDTYAMGNTMARAMMGQRADTWYYISFDYALGAALERDSSAVLASLGGKVLGSVKHPLGTTDFSSYLLQAQASGAKVVALADTGSDLINAVKQAAEFGLTKKQVLAGLFTQIVDVDSIGLQAAQGLTVTEAFYWDLNDNTRAFAQRFGQRFNGRMPTANQAGVYSSVLAYLDAVKTVNTIEGEAVVAEMRKQPIEDKLFGTVTVRQDGRAVHDMYTFRVKAPSESKSRWDTYNVLARIPGNQAFRPLDQGGCKLVTK